MSRVQLNFWLMPNADFDSLEVIQKEIAGFEKWHRTIVIEPTIIPWSQVWDRLMDVHKHQSEIAPPDIIQVGSTWVSTLSYLGVLRDISEFFEEDLTADIISHLQQSSLAEDGSGLMYLPWLADIRVLYYRSDVFGKCGLSAKDLTTFNKFKHACQVIQKQKSVQRTLAPFRLSGHSEVIQIHDLAPWIWGSGGALLSEDLKTVAFDRPEAKKALRWFFGFVNRLYGTASREQQYGIMPSGTFFSGNYASEIIGKYPLANLSNLRHSNYLRSVADNYDIAPFPKGPAGSVPFIGGSGLGIPRWSRYPQEAAEWIRFLVSGESQLRHGRRIGVFPARMSLLEKYLSREPRHHEVIKQTLAHGASLPPSPLLGTLERIIYDFSERILKAIRSGIYSERFLDEEILQAAQEANAIFSMYTEHHGKKSG